jgi:hypothetical protein
MFKRGKSTYSLIRTYKVDGFTYHELQNVSTKKHIIVGDKVFKNEFKENNNE